MAFEFDRIIEGVPERPATKAKGDAMQLVANLIWLLEKDPEYSTQLIYHENGSMISGSGFLKNVWSHLITEYDKMRAWEYRSK
jgi:hypothetical protein